VIRRGLAAAGLLTGAWVHLDLYRHGYRYIPTIGRLFLVNVIASTIVAVVVVLRLHWTTRIAAIGVAVSTLGAFGASRLPGGIFHFQERGWQPAPQTVEALVAELLVITAMVSGGRRALRSRRPRRQTTLAPASLSAHPQVPRP